MSNKYIILFFLKYSHKKNIKIWESFMVLISCLRNNCYGCKEKKKKKQAKRKQRGVLLI
jgi:hypothetical protein